MRNFLTLFCLLQTLILSAQKHIVYFESAKDSISQLEATALDSVINALNPSKTYIVEITGHTDSIGGIKYNQALSKRRAQTIQQYINKSKISFDIFVFWKAFFNPAKSSVANQSLALNRRVEINFTEVIPKKDTLYMPVQEFDLKNSKAYVLHTKNGCKLRIKPSSFKVNAGDTVHVLITEYNDPTDFLVGGLPMSYTEGQQEFMYQSEQMMKIEAIANGKPVQLLQMIGLECPDIELSEGLRLYKFYGNEASFVNVEPKKITGFAEEVEIEEIEAETLKIKEIEIDTLIEEHTNKDIVSNNKDAQKKETPQPKVKNKSTTNNSSSNSSNRSFSKGNKKKKRSRKKQKRNKKKKQKKVKKGNSSKGGFGGFGGGGLGGKTHRNKSTFKLKPDTGRAFILEPDTGFLLEPDTARSSPTNSWSKPDDCTDLSNSTSKNLCDLDTFKKIVAFGYQLNKDNSIPLDLDLNSYFVRYKSPAYSGMILKEGKNSNQLNYVQISTKKRFLRRQLLLKFESTPNHPEYLPLEGTKWIIYYRKERNQARRIKNIHVNDFRILPFKKSNYSKKSKEGYYIELKGDDEMFRFAARPKKKKKVAKIFKKYQKLHRDRVRAFDDSLRQIIDSPTMVQHLQLYQLLKKLSWSRPHPCIPSSDLSPCLDFKIMELEQNPSKYIRTLGGNLPPRKPDCPEQDFMDWLRFYNANSEALHKQIVELKENLPRYFKCICGADLDTTSIDIIEPCQKWEYADINSVGNKITYIGLGTYNFDYVFKLGAKQVIANPVFVTTQGDTLRTCWNIRNQVACGHELYSIVPNFNGLLKHNFLPRFSLLQNKENILFLTLNNKRYKCYVDMRNKDKFAGNTFIVQDITEQSKTLEALRNELIK